MIRAVVYRAEWDHDGDAFEMTHPDEPPPAFPGELVEFWDFQRYGLPPNAGGLRAQPFGWLARCKTLDRVYRAWRAWLASDKGPEWIKDHRADWDVVKQVREIVYG